MAKHIFPSTYCHWLLREEAVIQVAGDAPCKEFVSRVVIPSLLWLCTVHSCCSRYSLSISGY